MRKNEIVAGCPICNFPVAAIDSGECGQCGDISIICSNDACPFVFTVDGIGGTCEEERAYAISKWNERRDKYTPILVREKLSEYAHDAWSGWMDYMFSVSQLNEDGTVAIPKEQVDRWQRQRKQSYATLTQQEKNSDQQEAYNIIFLLTKLGISL